MSEPFLAEIRIMSFNFAPKGWALCNGQLATHQPKSGACFRCWGPPMAAMDADELCPA